VKSNNSLLTERNRNINAKYKQKSIIYLFIITIAEINLQAVVGALYATRILVWSIATVCMQTSTIATIHTFEGLRQIWGLLDGQEVPCGWKMKRYWTKTVHHADTFSFCWHTYDHFPTVQRKIPFRFHYTFHGINSARTATIIAGPSTWNSLWDPVLNPSATVSCFQAPAKNTSAHKVRARRVHSWSQLILCCMWLPLVMQTDTWILTVT